MPGASSSGAPMTRPTSRLSRYLDLFAMETMNHIRTKRRKAVPKPPAAPKSAARLGGEGDDARPLGGALRLWTFWEHQ